MYPFNDSPTVLCGLCGNPTTMTATKRCDRCWELESRVSRDPRLALEVLRQMGAPGQRDHGAVPVGHESDSPLRADIVLAYLLLTGSLTDTRRFLARDLREGLAALLTAEEDSGV